MFDLPATDGLPQIAPALGLSLLAASLAVVLGLAPAVAIGYALSRGRFWGRSLLGSIVLVPLVLPPVVTGLLLLRALGPASGIGRVLAAFGVQIGFSTPGVVVAATLAGLPLYALAARAAFDAVDPRLEDVARSLGCTRPQAFWRVTLPLARGGIAAGAVLAFARALGEFGATVVLAGNLEGRTRTLPLAVYTLLESPGGETRAWTLAAISVALSVGCVVVYERLLPRRRSP